MKKNKKKKPGFTLVEMVIVIAILGILSSLGFMKLGKVQQNAKLNADYIAASSIATAASLALQDKELTVETISIDSLVTKEYLSLKPMPQSSSGDFSIQIIKDNILVKVGNDIFYPKTK